MTGTSMPPGVTEDAALTIGDWIKQNLQSISNSVAEVEEDTKLLLSYFNVSPNKPYEATNKSIEDLQKVVARRTSQKIPVAYLLGETRFYGSRFFIAATEHDEINAAGEEQYRSYIPRRETEILVEKALAYCQVNAQKVRRIVDIATGSGCIAVSVKKNFPQAEMTAVEISEEALKVAKRNAAENDVDVNFLQGSLFDPLLDESIAKFDLILCNPPYVPREMSQEEKASLSDKALHEPEQAHYPEGSPEALYHELFLGVKACLHSDGMFMFETGFGQFQTDTTELLSDARAMGFEFEAFNDHDNVERFLIGKFRQ